MSSDPLSITFARRIVTIGGDAPENSLDSNLCIHVQNGPLLESLIVEITGFETIKYCTKKGVPEEGEHETSVVYFFSDDLTDELGGSKRTLGTDPYSVPFRHTFPETLPQSLLSEPHGRISYTICFRLRTIGGENYSAMQIFYLLRAPRLFRAHEAAGAVTAERTVRLGLRGSAKLGLSLPSGVLNPSAVIPVRCVVRNNSRRVFRCVKVSIDRVITFNTKPRSARRVVQLCKKAFDCEVRPGQTLSCVYPFALPGELKDGVPRLPCAGFVANRDEVNLRRSCFWSSIPARDAAAKEFSDGALTSLITVDFRVRLMLALATAKNPKLRLPFVFEQLWPRDAPPPPASPVRGAGPMLENGLPPPPPPIALPSAVVSSLANPLTASQDFLSPDTPRTLREFSSPPDSEEYSRSYEESGFTSSSGLSEIRIVGFADDESENSSDFVPAMHSYAPLPSAYSRESFRW